MNVSKFTRRRLRILEALRNHSSPVSGATLAAELAAGGLDISERTIRDDLAVLSAEGATLTFGRRGHVLSAKGRSELMRSKTVERIGFLSAKIDAMTYGMDFDLERCSGTVMVNTTVCRPSQLKAALDEVCAVFAKGYSMGTLVSLVGPGERVGEIEVPAGMVGFCTVCSITMNGILLKHGVPMRSRFGGLVELRNAVPSRFTEAIDYTGTSLDPLVIFIRGGFTNYRNAIRTGNGLIGASFREFPAAALDTVRSIAERVEEVGLGCFMEIGLPGAELLGIPVSGGCCGAVVIGGLNPVSIMEERGDHVIATALSGFMEYERLFPYTELAARLRAL
jgi:repressor of nif and glnA expression